MKLILLIDDDEQIRFSFGMALRTFGYRVIESDSGVAGLEMARQQMPDLILTDINMPGGGGQALLQQIRADPELCSKQVVLMTGRTDLVSPRKGMEQGADDFLVKPVSKDALLSCLEARLNRADIHWRVKDQVLTKLRSSLTSQLPHELITPLAGILGLSEILSTDSATLSSAEVQDLSKDIHLSALRLHRTVRNYLLMLELQSEVGAITELPPPLSFLKLQESLKTGVDLAVERHDRGEDITVNWEKCPILARPQDLALIVEELVDNAFKFSRRGTPVSVCLDNNGTLLITDEGRGMSPEEIGQISAFRQFDRKKHEQQGLGLGLILVQNLAARNGATCSVTCLPQQGIQDRVEFQLGASAPAKIEIPS
jgi:two-component system sensor histidine kinase/response regulator